MIKKKVKKMGLILYCDICGDFCDVKNNINYKVPERWNEYLIENNVYCICSKPLCHKQFHEKYGKQLKEVQYITKGCLHKAKCLNH